MKMNMKKMFLALALASSAFTSNLMAADIEAGVMKRAVDVDKSPALTDFLATYPVDTSELESKSSFEYSTSLSVASLAAASGISYFEIGQVGSSNVGWESISPNQLSTASNHGGSLLYTYVWQVGLGNINNASMNGLTKSPQSSEPRCGSNLHQCISGETVTGFLYLFNFSGQQGGNFTVSANSVASPFGYWSDSIYIQ